MDAIARVKQLMLETYKSPYSIEELCDLVGESYHTFRKQFRRVEGICLSEYYQRLRLQEAERLLRETDMRIFEIAYELGFADESNFSKWFYKRKNIWPTVYREQFKLEPGGVSF